MEVKKRKAGEIIERVRFLPTVEEKSDDGGFIDFLKNFDGVEIGKSVKIKDKVIINVSNSTHVEIPLSWNFGNNTPNVGVTLKIDL